ncbi:MAG: GntR family transcriptional regulator [Castellaniella sp.]|nr:GntR family transcriptional regulator [Castellaniella sp.]
MEPAKTRTQSVTDELRDLIIQGQLKPGERVQEIPLAKRLNVSRTPIRAALSSLASEGYLIYHPNRGYYIHEFNIMEIMQAYEIRAALESLAARKAAENGMNKDQEIQLRECLSQGDRILDKGYFAPEDLAPYRQMNIGIHEGVIHLAGSARLANAIKHTHTLPLASDRIILWQDLEILKRSHDDHHRVIDAILSRNPMRAAHIMEEHVYYAGLALREHLRAHGGLGLTVDPEKLAAFANDLPSYTGA